MTAPRRPARRGRSRWPLVVLIVIAAAAVFLLGVGLGLTLEERPRPSGNITSVRTLEPLPLPSAATDESTDG